MREYAKDLLRYGQNTRPNLIQGRRNVFEHGEDPSFKIVPLAPSKQSTPPVLGISVCLISFLNGKVEKILKGSMDSISSHLPSVKIQIMGRKDCLRRKGKTLLGIVNKLFVFKILLTTLSNVLPLHLKQTLRPMI